MSDTNTVDPNRATDDTVDRLISILSDYTSQSTTVLLSSNLVTDLGLDSMSLLDLTLRLENEFQITDLDYDPQHMQTVLDLAQVIDSNIKSASPSPAPSTSSMAGR